MTGGSGGATPAPEPVTTWAVRSPLHRAPPLQLLASGTDARLAGEVRAILRGRGLQVVDSVGGGRVPELHLEGAVELSDAGDVAGTGFMSSNAAASLQVVDTATGAVVAASRARARGAGISAGDARDRAGIRAVEEALAALVDDLIAVWPGR